MFKLENICRSIFFLKFLKWNKDVASEMFGHAVPDFEDQRPKKGSHYATVV